MSRDNRFDCDRVSVANQLIIGFPEDSNTILICLYDYGKQLLKGGVGKFDDVIQLKR
jgi:hypothetical protein